MTAARAQVEELAVAWLVGLVVEQRSVRAEVQGVVTPYWAALFRAAGRAEPMLPLPEFDFTTDLLQQHPMYSTTYANLRTIGSPKFRIARVLAIDEMQGWRFLGG